MEISSSSNSLCIGFEKLNFSWVSFSQEMIISLRNVPLCRFLWFPQYHGLASAVNAYKYFQDGSLKQYGSEGTDKPKETWVNLWMLGLHIHSWFRFINGRRLLSLLQHHLGISESDYLYL